jgi:hypothetical protein
MSWSRGGTSLYRYRYRRDLRRPAQANAREKKSDGPVASCYLRIVAWATSPQQYSVSQSLNLSL